MAISETRSSEDDSIMIRDVQRQYYEYWIDRNNSIRIELDLFVKENLIQNKSEIKLFMLSTQLLELVSVISYLKTSQEFALNSVRVI